MRGDQGQSLADTMRWALMITWLPSVSSAVDALHEALICNEKRTDTFGPLSQCIHMPPLKTKEKSLGQYSWSSILYEKQCCPGERYIDS